MYCISGDSLDTVLASMTTGASTVLLPEHQRPYTCLSQQFQQQIQQL